MDNSLSTEEKAPVSPEVRAFRQAARMIGRVVFQQNYRASHPEATGKEIKDAVEASKADLGKTGKQIMKALEKAGLTFTVSEAPAKVKKTKA